MKTILITGGSGFFGAYLTEILLNEGYAARVLDRDNIEDEAIKKRISFFKGDVRDKDLADKACKDIDYLFHNAAIVPVSRSSKREFLDINVNGTRNILERALLNKVKKVVFVSSSAPYGIPKEIPITEDTKFNPVCDYGRSKIEAEKVCNEYRRKGLNIIIIRPRTIVGSGRLGIFQILFSWIADNKRIYTIGDGKNRVQLMSKSDFAQVCLASIRRECVNEDFNIGAGGYGTVNEDLEGLIKYTGSSSKICHIPEKLAQGALFLLDKTNLSPFTPWHYKTAGETFYFNTSKAEKLLGWQPKMSNIDMLKDGYDWYIKNRNSVDSHYGTTHTYSVRQKILRVLKGIS